MYFDTTDENERLKLIRLYKFRRTRQTQAGQLNTEPEWTLAENSSRILCDNEPEWTLAERILKCS